jgi:hypothetical protein
MQSRFFGLMQFCIIKSLKFYKKYVFAVNSICITVIFALKLLGYQAADFCSSHSSKFAYEQ